MEPSQSIYDTLLVTPLGAGQEVGRSCIIVEFRGKKIMLDCGIHPGYSGLAALPYIDQIDPSSIDVLFVTHFHLDHCGALPWFLTKTSFKGRVFMTHATKAIYRSLMMDFLRLDESLFNKDDVEESMEKIETVHFHQQHQVSNIKFSCYHAGHVLGAAMFFFEIAGVKLLYTGDFSRNEDRHLMSAEIPNVSPDVLIMESTFGIHLHENRQIREQRLTKFVHDTLVNGGNCLIPIFALGCVQELLLITDEYWERTPQLQSYPVYFASSLAKKCMAVYQTYTNGMNEQMKKTLMFRNPFNLKHVQFLKSLDNFDHNKPSLVFASPGMLQTGISRYLFEMWCSNPKNGVMLAGYSVEGTLAKQLSQEPDQIVAQNGKILPRRCSVASVTFASHADFGQITEFVSKVKPTHIVLVHGEKSEMNRLRNALVRDNYVESDKHIHTPANCFQLELYFKGLRLVKILGDMVSSGERECNDFGGVIVKRGFEYHIIAPNQLESLTNLGIFEIELDCFVLHGEAAAVVDDYVAVLMRNLSGVFIEYAGVFSENVKKFKADKKINMRLFSVVVEIDTVKTQLRWSSNDKHSENTANLLLAVVLESKNNMNNAATTKNENPPKTAPSCNDNFRKIVHRYFDDSLVQEDRERNLIVIKNHRNEQVARIRLVPEKSDTEEGIVFEECADQQLLEKLRVFAGHARGGVEFRCGCCK